MQERRDQPGAAEVVECEQPASQRGDETVIGFLGQPCFEVGGQLAALDRGGFVTDGRFGGGDIFDLVVDGRVDRGVEVGDRGEQVAVGTGVLHPGVRRRTARSDMGRTTCSPAFVQVTGL